MEKQLTEISQEGGEESLKNIFLYALDVAKKAFGFENGEIFRALGNNSKTKKRYSDSTRKAIEQHKTVIEDINSHLLFTTPITYKGKVVGILKLTKNKTSISPKRDTNNAEVLASIVAISIVHSELNKEVKEKLRKLQLLYEIGRKLSETIKLDELLDIAINLIKDTFNFENTAVLLTNKSKSFLRIRKATKGYNKEKIKRLKISISEGEGLTGTAAKTGETIISNDVKHDKRYINGNPETNSEIAIPLKAKGKLLGVLDVESNVKNRFSDEDRKVLEAVANEIALAIDNAMLYEKMKKLAEKDELTKLFNYRAFRRQLDKEISRALRYKKTFSLAMFDIDFFKEYNDNNGHDIGNVALSKVGKIILKNCRDLDFPARFGGEEFIVILTETDKTGAFKCAERIRQIVEHTKFPGEEKQPNGKLTISGGIAQFPTDGNSVESIIKSVDIAAYKAKNTGRNKIVIFDKEGE
jgi:diguanylate cyclase (GGDEF)-like protein